MNTIVSTKINAKGYALREIFSSNFKYNIPNYQRPYAWGVDQATELFEDLYTSYYKKGNKDYFLGSIVLIKKEEKQDSDVVDGQQRLATLTILLAAIRSKIKDSDYKTELQSYIEEPGKKSEELECSPRLFLREQDKAFFSDCIQKNENNFNELLAGEPSNLENEAQRNIQSNAKCFINKLENKFDNDNNDENLAGFIRFLMKKCYLVVIDTPTQDSAVRIFSVLNTRGLDLQNTDIIKAEILREISENDRSKYSKRWEDMENNLGRELFNDLFAFIRMIFAKEKAQKSLLEEFREHVLKKRPDTEKLFSEVLEPYAEALGIVKKSAYSASSKADETNTYLRWLNSIDNSDWLPVTILFMSKQKDNPQEICLFFKKLERLAAYLHICAKHRNDRIRRYNKIITLLENGDRWKNPDSILDLNEEEKGEMKEALDGNIYELRPSRRNYVILRLDSFMSDGEATYKRTVLTIEHVLPQTIDENSEWAKDWPDPEKRKEWTHRISNLIPLNRRRNSEAQNYDFERKKKEYFSGTKNVPSYVLTSQIRDITSWTEKDLSERQEKLMSVFEENWDLRGKNTA